ncbi:flagellar hook-associated protein 2 [Bacillus sp. FJAT-45350]|uniref:flagellar hook-associated protein 2 n=1 Tax=Bacillus sp. FJAT-45350 TaxID=2011014 RepID=UPI0015CEAFE3|nr:flagellar hook-associated protein 2 [Bacillus sp. FJAT-45350]
MRMTGLATGMDIEQTVADLMRAERKPIDNMIQQREQLRWEQEDYREMNLELTKFRDNLFDGVIRASNMSAKEATSSYPARVTADASASASASSYTISKVEQLASAAYNVSNEKISEGNIDPNASIWSQQEHLSDAFTMSEEVVENERVVVEEPTNVLQLSNGAIKTAGEDNEFINVSINNVGYQVVSSIEDLEMNEQAVYVDKEQGTLVFNEEVGSSDDVTVDYTYQSIEFGIDAYSSNGKVEEVFEFNGSSSLNEILDEVNDSELPVNAFYDPFADKVSITRSETGQYNDGEGSEMNFSGSFLNDGLNLISSQEQGGENAKFTINGLSTERQENNFTIDGVSITLHDTFEDQVTVNVNVNNDHVFDTVMEFVEDYNGLIDTVNGKLSEDRNRDFHPLTDEQKQAMSEQEIERWEEQARSGMIRNDRMLSAGLNQLRIDIYSNVGHSSSDIGFSQIAELGITTTSNYQDGGRLEVDEERLRQAIEEDPEAVYQIFASDGESYEEKGIARRMRDSLQGTIEQVSERAGRSGITTKGQYTIGREIQSVNDRISNFERRMQQVEERYWNQFNAMEAAVAQANAQAESMFSMLAGGGQAPM